MWPDDLVAAFRLPGTGKLPMQPGLFCCVWDGDRNGTPAGDSLRAFFYTMERDGTMKTLHIRLSGGRDYDIRIGRGLLDELGPLLREIWDGKRVAVVTDSNVAPLYGDRVETSLRQAGFETKRVVFPAGEKSKNLSGLELIYDQLLSPEPFTLTRSDLVVALGGGVTGDMAGFAAGTILRGVPYVQVPTTLLAQVDSSVGGKVAVDLKQGKNLAGLFYQPKLVLIDPDTLQTLPDRVFLDGMGEVVKYGLIREPALWRLLSEVSGREALQPFMEEILYTCCDCKRRIVEADERDTGERMLLNFGHTIGHAYEKLGGYEKWMHGEAVACGMYAILRIGEQHGFTRPGLAASLRELLTRQGMPWDAGAVPEEELVATLAYDKKGSGSTIRPVFVRTPGNSFYEPLPRETFVDWVLSKDDTPEMPAEKESLPPFKKAARIWSGALSGEVTLPGSKSVGHRMVIAASLAGGESCLKNLTPSKDIDATLLAVESLGAKVLSREGDAVTLMGIHDRPQSIPVIDCGESGSTLRFMIPVALAVAGGCPVSFTGHGRLMERPLQPYFDLFAEKGIAYHLQDGVLTVQGKLTPGEYRLSGKVSSQFITGLLLALPVLAGEGESRIVITDSLESKGYVDMTLAVLRQFGIEAENVNGDYTVFRVPAGQQYRFGHFTVEGDYSQAAFFLAYNAAAGGGVTLKGLNPDSVQGDKAAAEILAQYPQAGDLTVDASGIPDLIPALAVAAAFRAEGSVTFAHAGRLRLKESDRLATTFQLLSCLGAEVEEGEDWLRVNGTGYLPGGGVIDCCNDHRIAMSGAVAAALAENSVLLLGTECVNKSYPAFWTDFAALGGRYQPVGDN